jgi:hypothetical protein
MTEFLLALAIFVLAGLGLGVGLAFGRGPLKSSCGASADLPEGRCKDCPLRHRTRCPDVRL